MEREQKWMLETKKHFDMKNKNEPKTGLLAFF